MEIDRCRHVGRCNHFWREQVLLDEAAPATNQQGRGLFIYFCFVFVLLFFQPTGHQVHAVTKRAARQKSW
jgi:hypothetical protein